MYTETGILLPYSQNFSQEIQLPREFCKTQNPNVSMSDPIEISTIYEYDMGDEGDLFKAPELTIEELDMGLDPLILAFPMISCGEDGIYSQGLEVTDLESLQTDRILNENDLYYEFEKDLLEKAVIEAPVTPLSEVSDIKIPVLGTDENQIPKNNPLLDVPFQKSVSLGCLSTMDWMQGGSMKPSFLDFQEMDLSAVYGMRRAFSEGDIKPLNNPNISLIHSPLKRPLIINNCASEERREKLSRYRNKKRRRDFGRKIKYACRKALADSQPRIRGRFAKTEECDLKRQ